MDLVDIARIERLLDAKGERVLRRLFADGEVGYSMQRARPAQHLAVRLAAKEAAFKALSGTERARTIGWREVEIVNGLDGGPTIVLHGAALERATELGVSRMWVTLTHSMTTAGAVVVLER
jgi:holo-[acyl-carrier protein] synthase